MKPSSADPSRDNLQQQLQILDRAIEILATDKNLQTSPSRSSQSRRGPPPSSSALRISQSLSHLLGKKEGTYNMEEDESFKIQTMVVETITCPDCLQQVDLKTFKLHETQLCTNKIITCPNAGCNTRMNASSLKFHLQEECPVAKQRRALLQRAELRLREKEENERKRKEAEQQKREEAMLRMAEQAKLRAHSSSETAMEETVPVAKDADVASPPVVVCNQCGEAVRESQLSYHMKNTCYFRLLMCPNYGSGCKETKIPFAHINQHLREDCPAEQLRDQLIAKSRHRLERVQCSTCGEMVMLAQWRRHETELCPNRLVPCRNHHLGCPCMIPMKERYLHEHIDEQYERYALYLPGSSSHLAIDEGDITSPWTAEFWMYKPHATESLKHHLINMFLTLPAYEAAFAMEMLAHRNIMKIVIALRDDTVAGQSEAVKQMDKNERKAWQKAQAEQKVAWVNELSRMIPVYTDAMLGYLRAFQSLAINVEAALSAAREIKFQSSPSWNADTLISLQSDYPGRPAEQKNSLGSFAAAVGETTPAYAANSSSPSIRHKKSNTPGVENRDHAMGGISEEINNAVVSADRSLLTHDDWSSSSVSTAHAPNKPILSWSEPSSRPATTSSTRHVEISTRRFPVLSQDDLERIASLWQGESQLCKMFQFACQSIQLEDMQNLVQAEQLIFEQLQAAHEVEMNTLEENHRSWLAKEEEKERLLAEAARQQAETKEALVDDGESASGNESKEENMESEENEVENENEPVHSASEIEQAEVGQRRPPSLAPEEAIEHTSTPELEVLAGHGEHVDKLNLQILSENVDYQDSKDAKRMYPDLWDSGGALRLLLFQRALEKERLLLREIHVAEIDEQLKKLEAGQNKQAQAEQKYSRFMDELVDILGASFPAVQNTQQLLYHWLHAPISILFPAMTGQLEQFHRNKEIWSGYDDGDEEHEEKQFDEKSIFSIVRKSERATAHTIDDWVGLLHCVARLIKRDFDGMQKLRISAGLLTPDPKIKRKHKKDGMGEGNASTAGEATPSTPRKSEEELEKAARKKEKEKQRREMRKNKKALEQEEQQAALQAAQDAAAAATADVLSSKGRSSVKPDAPIPTTGNNKDVKIITRTSELFRSGCGSEILAEASTVNNDGNRCRLICSMFSGLSLLTMKFDEESLENGGSPSQVNAANEGDDDVEDDKYGKDDHHYDLLLSKAEFQRLSTYTGQVGLISAPSTSSGPKMSPDKKNNKQTLIDSLGSQVMTFNAKIMRGKWTHLAFVSQPASIGTPSKSRSKSRRRPSRKSKNAGSKRNKSHSSSSSSSARLLLYMDGQYIGGQRDCSMALPMMSIGGSPWSLQSFCGVMLDIRYWARPRSGQQINNFAHRLVRLSPIAVSHSGSSNDAPVDYHADANRANADGGISEDAGLIGWWTFDDGPGTDVVTDVTRHRFKTPLHHSILTAKAMKLTATDLGSPSPGSVDVVDNGVNSKGVVVRSWDIRYETGDPFRYPTPYELLQEYRGNIAKLANAKQPELPVYLGMESKRDKLYQVSSIAAPAAINMVAVSSVQGQTNNLPSNNSRPTTSNSRPTTSGSGFKNSRSTGGKNSIQSATAVVMSFNPQPRAVLSTPFHFQSALLPPRVSSPGLFSPNYSVKTGNSQVHSGPTGNRPIQTGSNWMQKLWSRMRRHNWICAETIPIFATASSIHESEEKDKKEKEKKKKMAVLAAARKIPTNEDIRKKDLENKKKKTPHLPYYLMEEHKMRAESAGNLNVLPLPSFHEQNLCLFELRRHRLAKQGRLLYSLVTCPLECGARSIQKRQLRHHIQHICPKRMIHCRFFAYCGALFPAEMQEIHEAHSCAYLKRFSHAKTWADRAQWTKEHQHPCPDCNEPVLMLNAEQEEQLKKDISRLEAKGRLLRSKSFPATKRLHHSMRRALAFAEKSVENSDDSSEDGENSEEEEEEEKENESLMRAEEQYRKSWVYHREFTCLYRKVYCPRLGCDFAKRDIMTNVPSSASPVEKASNTADTAAVEKKSLRFETATTSLEKSQATVNPANEGIISAPRLPYFLLRQHLDRECNGYDVQQRCVLIDRARSRHPYPRPWGITIHVPKNLEEAAEAILAGTLPNEPLSGPEEDLSPIVGNETGDEDDHSHSDFDDSIEEDDNDGREEYEEPNAGVEEDTLLDV